MLASRHIGALLSRDLLDGKREARPAGGERFTMGRQQQTLSRDLLDWKSEARSSGSERFTMGRQQQAGTPVGREVNQSAVDARSLGVGPAGAQDPPLIRRFLRDDFNGRQGPSEVNQSAVDARSLGVRPEGAQGSPLIRRVLRDDFNERQGPSERSIYQPRNLQDDNGAQTLPRNDTNIFQQRSPREVDSFQQRPAQDESARYTGVQRAGTAGQNHQTRFPRDQSSFQNRSSTGEGRAPQASRSRPGRPRASRDNDDSEPKRRKRGAERDSGGKTRPGAKVEKWTEEEQQYLKEHEERKAPKALEFEPVEFSRETFAGMGPATPSDEWGMSEMLGERLLLARNHLDGEFIQWDSKEQKADVMAMAEKLKAVGRGRKPSGNEDEQAQALMHKLLAGEYAKFKRPGEKDVLGLVEMHVHRNDSFYPDDEKSLLDKVRSIMPAQQASKVGREARNEVKA